MGDTSAVVDINRVGVREDVMEEVLVAEQVDCGLVIQQDPVLLQLSPPVHRVELELYVIICIVGLYQLIFLKIVIAYSMSFLGATNVHKDDLLSRPLYEVLVPCLRVRFLVFPGLVVA